MGSLHISAPARPRLLHHTSPNTLLINLFSYPKSSKMCFYDQYQMSCGCGKWGNFRQHCAKEYRTGETCGMKLVMHTYPMAEKCKLCEKIATKQRTIRKEEERIDRWRRDTGRSASIEKSQSIIEQQKHEINKLWNEVLAKKRSL
ncbi:uncharacterized protein RSE6_03386 [Rhynchosporium secalis]|uniref:Uncharacterized protein n=1 Tax=Rhynchosporium secalis TaxID=38038 RepID=A0A1E1M2M5_RHYSE|nr:uncharacterized protein RSE6_03386 [Rhynchosporium secalis]